MEFYNFYLFTSKDEKGEGEWLHREVKLGICWKATRAKEPFIPSAAVFILQREAKVLTD